MKPYYEHAGITIYHGDCREVLASQSFSIDAVLSDPPYPGYEKGWDVPDVGAILSSLQSRVMAIFWPVMTLPPMSEIVAEHVWHKPNGCSAHHYERILMYGDSNIGCKVFRTAAILPNYVQYRRECEDHPTQKPIKLLLQLLRLTKATNVLDPFMGSGTTLAAAKLYGIPAIGIEIEERYCEIAARRMSQEVFDFSEVHTP